MLFVCIVYLNSIITPIHSICSPLKLYMCSIVIFLKSYNAKTSHMKILLIYQSFFNNSPSCASKIISTYMWWSARENVFSLLVLQTACQKAFIFRVTRHRNLTRWVIHQIEAENVYISKTNLAGTKYCGNFRCRQLYEFKGHNAPINRKIIFPCK